MSQPSQPQPVALNAISTLVVHNLVKDSSGRFQSITLTRRKAPTLELTPTIGFDTLPTGPPLRRPSLLPPPSDLELRLSAEDIIGDGRCGTIFATRPLHLSDLTDPSQQLISLSRSSLPYLPDLVIKVAQPSTVKDLWHEAAVYDEAEVLQGVSMPRCYGLFEADLGPAWMVSLSSSPMSDDGTLEEFGIDARDAQATRVSILLLERVGGLLPLKQKLADKSDIWAVFNDLSQLGLVQPDMRYSNILFAPSTGDSVEGTICPFHHRKHNYRVIDFDSVCKTNWTPKEHYFEQVGSLGRLLESMEWGIVLEPWEY